MHGTRKTMLLWVRFLHNDIPGPCWGSPEKRKHWQEHGGWDGTAMTIPLKPILAELERALNWALNYAECEHERSYPGETYDCDGNVAASVAQARETLARARAVHE